MPVETIPGSDATYFLITYDRDGRERPEGSHLLSEQAVTAVAQEPVTDVMLFSHGWNGDIPAARRQYGSWLQAMRQLDQDRAQASEARPGFRPLLIGLHWPSKAWGDEELGGTSYSPSEAQGYLVDDYAERIADTPAARKALEVIWSAALVDIAPPTLPLEVQEAYLTLEHESGLGAEGEGGEPGNDREVFDPEAVYETLMEEEALLPFGGTSFGGLLAPLRVLSFWTMKRRARHFGENGAADLLVRLQRAVPDRRDVRFHLAGHSFGSIAASAAVSGAENLARPVDSLTLVQGALSLWSYCERIPVRPQRDGYFRRMVTDGLVAGPVLVTTSLHDRAIGLFYPLGAKVTRRVDFVPGQPPSYGGLGIFGARGPGLALAELEIGGDTHAYNFRSGTFYNLESSSVIRFGGGVSGAHSDIIHPEVTHAVWQVILATVL